MAGPIANLTVRLSAQIAEFQSEFREAAKSTEKFQQEFTGMATKASALGNIIANGVTTAVYALKNLGQSVLDNASNITDLSAKTGLAMSTIQEFQHVAEQTGTSVDAFTDAVFKLGTNLSGGSKSVQAGIASLGLSFAEIQRLSPDEQFNRIAQALSEMENPQERNRIALELFGRGAKEIMPAIAEGYRKIADEARISGDAQIKALDAAGDRVAKFKRDFLASATEIAGSLLLIKDRTTSSWEEFDKFGARVGKFGFAGTFAIMAQEMKHVADEAERMARAVANAPKIGEISFASPGTGSQRPNQFGGATMDASELLRDLEKSKQAQEAATKAAQAHADAIRRIREEWTGVDAVTRLNAITAAFKGTIPLQSLSAEKQKELNKLTKEAIDANERLGRVVPQAWRDIYAATFDYASLVPEIPPAVRAIPDEFTRLGQTVRLEIPAAAKQLEGLKLTAYDVRGAFEANLGPSLWEKLFGGDFGGRLGQTILGAIQGGGNIIASAGSFIGTTLTTTLAKTITSGAGLAISGALGSAINAILPGLGALFGPLLDKVAGFFGNLFDRNKGRDLVEDFAESLGGFDALQKKLGELGEEGDKLWRMLTQGVGRNNPEQARKAIEAVTAALNAQKLKTEELTAASAVTTEAQAQATIETATAAAAALDEVSARLVENEKSWATWSENVTGYLQGLADTIRAMPLPGPTGTVRFDSGEPSPGSRVPVGGGAGSIGGATHTTVVEVEGEVLARWTVPYVPGELNRVGIG